MFNRNVTFAGSTLLVLAALSAIGCGNSNSVTKSDGTKQVAAKGDHDDHKTEAKGHDHSGWWCAEHGVPEGVCSQCSAKVAADFQKKGDWCAEHDRAKSQCFLCDPSLKDKFAAQYKAKEGKEPPAIEEEKDSAEAKKS
jgi:hypothetical protein